MITRLIFLAILAIHLAYPSCSAQLAIGGPRPGLYENSLLFFTENKGQITDYKGNKRPDILFSTGDNDAKIFLTPTGILYQFNSDSGGRHATYVVRVKLLGCNEHAAISKQEEHDFKENYYLANCGNGISGVSSYSKIVYQNLYNGIDWVLHVGERGFKYEFVVHPGADYSNIQLQVSDAEKIDINEKGTLNIYTALGKITESAPHTFCNGQVVPSSFLQESKGIIRFEVADYDKSQTLTIDPSVQWSTYYAGDCNSVFFGWSGGTNFCATDTAGNIYLAGCTRALTGVATTGGYQTTNGGGPYNGDIFLVKFSPAGIRLWATYFGSYADESVGSIAVDKNGDVYLCGKTGSISGIAYNGFQNTFGGSYPGSPPADAFLARFNSAGVRKWATYYGDNREDAGTACAVDGHGSVYLAGYTYSYLNIATAGAFSNSLNQSSLSSSVTGDAFLVRFDTAGNRKWGTYIGGAGGDGALSCVTDKFGHVILTGVTTSPSGITSANPFQAACSDCMNTTNNEGFIESFDSSGTQYWGTYFGGSGGNDYLLSCATDSSGNIFIAGYTSAILSFSTPGCFQYYRSGTSDMFLAKFGNGGNRLWATYYGGPGSETGGYTSLDKWGNIYLVGSTPSSTNIASANALQGTLRGYSDAAVVKFDATGSRKWATYYGGDSLDYGHHCTVSPSGDLYVTGTTKSPTGIATPNGYQPTFNAAFTQTGQDFLTKFCAEPGVSISASPGCSGQPLTFTAAASTPGTIINYNWRKNGLPVGNNSPTFISSTLTNTDTITCIITSNNTCGDTSAVSNTIVAPVLPFVIPIILLDTMAVTHLCAGVPVTIYTTSFYAGNAAQYQWYINGNAVAGATSSALTISSLATGDTVWVSMTSGFPCAMPSVVLSNKIIATIDTISVPAISIAASPSGPISAGQSVTFSAISTGGGIAPIYSWFKNGQLMLTGVSSTYTDFNLNDGDSVYAVITSSDHCANPTTAQSQYIITNVTSSINTSTVSSGFHLYPNPAKEQFTIVSDSLNLGLVQIYLLDAMGKCVLQKSIQAKSGGFRYSLDVPAHASHLYFVRIVTSVGVYSEPLLIEQ